MSEPMTAVSLVPAGDVEHPRTQLPDWRYAAKVAGRQAPFALALTCLLLPVALYLGLTRRDLYSSSVAAIYDDRDTAEPSPRFPYYPRFAQVAESFRARLAETEFLWQVAHDAGLTHIGPDANPLKAYLRTHLPLGDRLFPPAPERDLPDDERTKAGVGMWLRGMLSPGSDDKKNTLTLVAQGDDPLTARRLASAAMEQFIASELRYEAEGLGRSRDAYAAWLRDAGRDGPTPAGPRAAAVAGKPELAPLTDREAELLDQLQQAKAALERGMSHAAERRAALETELARLVTKLTPSHPDVIAKQDELRDLARGPDDLALAARVAQLRQALAEVHAKLRRAGLAAVPEADARAGGSGERGQFLGGLADRVSELGLEQAALAGQADAPAQRTRLRVFVPATYEEYPAVHARKSATLGLGLLAALTGLGAGLLRELRSPRARDGWRAAWRAGQPLLGEFGARSLREFPRLTPPVVAGLRHDQAAQPVLAAYRRLELELRGRLAGAVVLVLEAAPDGITGPFWANFLNVTGAETAGAVLLIDCDARDPVVPGGERGPAAGDLAALLSGRAPWKDTRLARTPDRAFDLVPPDAGAAFGAGRTYRPEALAKLFDGLGRGYGRVFVRGHGARDMLANAALAAVVTDCIVSVDAGRACYADVEAALAAVPPAKRRGVVMIGG